MSFIDWNAAALPGQIAGQQTQNAASQLALVQQNRALSALHGVDLSNPDSVGSALNGLAQIGMADQGKAVLDLAYQRALNQAKLPVATGAFGEAADAIAAQRAQDAQQSSQQPQPAQPSPQQLQQAQQTMQAASDAVGRIKAAPPNQRLAAWNAERQQFASQGLPTQALDAGGQHLSDANFSDEALDDLTNHYSEHAANFGAMAGGAPAGVNLSTHPTNAWNTGAASPPVGYPNTQQLQASDPNIASAQAHLNSPLRQPLVQGAITAATGIDQAPGFQQDIALTGPARQEAAHAAFAPTVAASTTTATNLANLNTLPAVQQAVAEASAKGSAAGSPMEITLPSGAVQKGIVNYDESGKPYFVPIGQAPTATGGQAGAPIASPTIAGAKGIAGGAQASVDAATAFENYTNGYKGRKANLDNLRQAAGDISTGPQAPFWGKIGQIAAEYGIQTPFAPTTDQTAAYEEVRKMALSVAAQQMSQLGLPATNQGTDIAAGTTPHEETSPLGIKRLTGVLEGNEDYGNATRQAWETWKNGNPAAGIPPHGYETYNQWLPGWMKLFDPRVFQAQYMDPAQQAAVKGEVGPKRFDAEAAAAKRLGYLGGS